MKLYREERQYLHMPFWGLDGASPEIQILPSETELDPDEWVALTAAPSYDPPPDYAPPTGYTLGDGDWYQVLLAGPDAEDNPVGTIVVTVTSQVLFRTVAGDEVDILPDTPEWITLI